MEDTHIQYTIYGRLRDCMDAGRLLWIRLTKEYAVYVHESYRHYLKEEMVDQESRVTLKNLYPGVSFVNKPDLNMIAIQGPYWMVKKVRAQLISRFVQTLTPSEPGSPVTGTSLGT